MWFWIACHKSTGIITCNISQLLVRCFKYAEFSKTVINNHLPSLLNDRWSRPLLRRKGASEPKLSPQFADILGCCFSSFSKLLAAASCLLNLSPVGCIHDMLSTCHTRVMACRLTLYTDVSSVLLLPLPSTQRQNNSPVNHPGSYRDQRSQTVTCLIETVKRVQTTINLFN